MTNKAVSLMLLCAFALGVPAHAVGQDGRNAMADAMAEAMVRMMDAMGLFRGGSFGSWDRIPTVPGMTLPFGSPMGMPGVSPWGMPMQDPSKAFGLGTEMMQQWSPQGATGAVRGEGAEPLDGVWEGSGGDLLIVQGGRYRIYAPQDQHIDGWLQTRSSQVALYNVQDGQTQVFEYAARDGRLALRDTGGQVFLYRRFGGVPAAPISVPAAPEVPEPPAAPPASPKTSAAR
jgi:hypothetical protein